MRSIIAFMGKVIVYLQVRFNYYLYKLGWLWRTNVMSRYVSFKIHHVYGPEKIKYAPNELIVISIVRDGAKYIESFMDHYRVMGICHFVFLDNGSRDDTISKLKGYDHVTILQTNCTYHKYENALKTYLVKRFSQNRWNLFADIDELFDYPYSDKIRVSELLSYLNENRYTAVVAQMLDMFSHLPFSQLEQTKPGSLKSKYTYYDISNIEKRYYKYGKLSNKNIQWHFHGIRSMLFGSNNGLTKAALIFVDGKINPFIDYHQTLDSSVADFSTVLYHYPFTEAFYTKVKEAIETNRYGIWTCEYQRYWDGMTNAPELSMKLPTASCFEGTNKLIEDNFLVVSDKYIQWVNQKRGQIMAGQSKIHGEESLVL